MVGLGEEREVEVQGRAVVERGGGGAVVVGGGPVGVASNGFVWESTDAGKSWAKSILKGHGYVMDADLLAAGAGSAVSCVARCKKRAMEPLPSRCPISPRVVRSVNPPGPVKYLVESEYL